MRNILIIVAHPSQNSFNYSLYKEIIRLCRSNSIQYKTIDLYREDFDPIIRESELEINKKMIENYQSLISHSDIVIFISPVWWARGSTMLEGFFDKVFTNGFAFSIDGNFNLKPLLVKKKVVFFLSLGTKLLIKNWICRIITSLRLKYVLIDTCFKGSVKFYFPTIVDGMSNNHRVSVLGDMLFKLRRNI